MLRRLLLGSLLGLGLSGCYYYDGPADVYATPYYYSPGSPTVTTRLSTMAITATTARVITVAIATATTLILTTTVAITVGDITAVDTMAATTNQRMNG